MIFVPDTRVHLANLTSYTPYLVTLSAFNTAGDGPPSDPRGTRTLQAGESSSGFCFFLLPVRLPRIFSPFTCYSFRVPPSAQPAQLPVLLGGDGRKRQRVLGSAAVSQRTAGGLQGDLPAHCPCARSARTHAHTKKNKKTVGAGRWWGDSDFVFCGGCCVRAGVSKVVTVDVRGSWQRWLRVRDLIRGATYTFSIQALTVGYGPPIQANLTAQPVKGRYRRCGT